MLRKILAHLSIIFAGMCFVLFVIDRIKGGAMSFINNDITKAFIAILSLLSILISVITLSAQTREQKLLSMLQAYRQKFGPLPQSREVTARPAAPRSTAASRAVAAPSSQRRASSGHVPQPGPVQRRASAPQPARRPASSAPQQNRPVRRPDANPPQRSRYTSSGAQGSASRMDYRR